jgi:hypothetical protein
LTLEIEGGHITAAASQDWRAQALSDGGNDLYFPAISGMQKEIRRGRGDRAFAFAKLAERARPKSVKPYLRRIVHEECRSIALVDRFYVEGITLRDLVELAASASKDWETEGDRGIFSPHWYRVAHRLGWDEPTCETAEVGICTDHWPSVLVEATKPDSGVFYRFVDAIGNMIAAEKWEDLYEVVAAATMWTKQSMILAVYVRRALCDLMREAGTPVERLRSNSGHLEELITLWHRVQGHPEPVLERKQFNLFPADFPLVDIGMLDTHTRQGKAELAKFGHFVKWGRPQPPTIDIRWSGASAGTLWRYLAFAQHGSVDVPFESVEVPRDVLETFKATRSRMV